MAETKSKVPEKSEKKAAVPAESGNDWHPFESLRREVDRLFDEFHSDAFKTPFKRSILDVEPFWRRWPAGSPAPAVDIVENDKAFEVTAEIPGMDEKNVQVTLDNGSLKISGEKKEETEKKEKDYYVRERRFGSFERNFAVPENVDVEKIDAVFKNGVLKVTLPKKANAKPVEKKIAVKAA